MTITAILAYFLIVCYFFIERLLRKREKALSFEAGTFDRNSSKIIWICGLLNILLIGFAPVLNTYPIGYWNSACVGWAGLLLMLNGLILRYWAARTLGEFYTRTLRTIEGQQIIAQIPYNVIRHPGYLGTFLMEVVAGLAVANWMVLVIIVVTGILSRAYRIQVEEDMLKTVFAEQYKFYSEKTWRFIPFIY
jgi:protein-S-isoprenylcysteine O-methyltransferase Ste14